MILKFPSSPSHGDACHLLSHIGETALSSIALPSCVIALVSEPPLLQPVLQLTHVAPRLVVLQPWVDQRLLDRVTPPHFHLQKVCDQLDCLCGDLLPRVRWVHEGGVLDLLVDILVLIERESAREGDVDDHASAPHVQRPVVALVPQDLWCQICWSSNNGLPEALLPNYPRKPKIAQLDLWE